MAPGLDCEEHAVCAAEAYALACLHHRGDIRMRVTPSPLASGGHRLQVASVPALDSTSPGLVQGETRWPAKQ